jgi:hypothetical protein
MKNLSKTLLTAIALACLPAAIFANSDANKDDPKAEPEIQDKKPKVSTKIVTTVIGPDGKVTTTQEGHSLQDLNKIIEEATGAALKQIGDIPLDELLKSGSGSVTVIGSDGKVTTKKLSGEGGLNQIIQDALKQVQKEGVELQVVDVEKPFIQDKGGLRKEINQLRKELAAQRKLLEQILEKLN